MRWMHLRWYRLNLCFHLFIFVLGLLLLWFWRLIELFGILFFEGFRGLLYRSFNLYVIIRICMILALPCCVTITSVLRFYLSLFCRISLNRAFEVFLLIILLSSILEPCRLNWLLMINRVRRELSCSVLCYLRSRRSVLVGWFRLLWQLWFDRCWCVCWRVPWCGGRKFECRCNLDRSYRELYAWASE